MINITITPITEVLIYASYLVPDYLGPCQKGSCNNLEAILLPDGSFLSGNWIFYEILFYRPFNMFPVTFSHFFLRCSLAPSVISLSFSLLFSFVSYPLNSLSLLHPPSCVCVCVFHLCHSVHGVQKRSVEPWSWSLSQF